MSLVFILIVESGRKTFFHSLLFNLYPTAKIKENLSLQKTVCYHLVVHLLHSTVFVSEGYKKDVPEQRKHSDKYIFYTLRFDCSFAAANTIKPQLL